MDSDNVTDTLAHRQVVEVVGEEHYRDVVDGAIFAELAGGVGNLQCGEVFVGFVGLVGESGVKDNCVEVLRSTSHIALVQSLIGVGSALGLDLLLGGLKFG